METLEELDWCLDQLESLQVQDGEDDKDKDNKKYVWGHENEEDGTDLLFLSSFYTLNQTVSDPSECVRHGSQQVQENVEQGIIRVQVAI